MEKLLYIDACIRGEESRTLEVATPIVEQLSKTYDVTTICLNDLELDVMKKTEVLAKNNGVINEQSLYWASLVRDADRIVIASPFWDMSIPAALKVFFEHCSIFDITFKSDDKTCYGNCNAKKMLYITSRGMDISTGDELDGATSYLKALSWLWGIGPLQVVAMQNMDYSTQEEIEQKIQTAIAEGLEICKTF